MKLPAPKAFAWISRATENTVGAECIIIKRAGGVPLSQIWDRLAYDDKQALIETVIGMEVKFASTTFNAYGNLYYEEDLTSGERIRLDRLSGDGGQLAIGPSTERKLVEDG